ncbi:MAG: GNAT family N-acetyltransferase [Promethearchaeota archaeon]
MQNVDIVEEINDKNFYLRKISIKDTDFIYESLKAKTLTKYLSLGPLISRDHAKKLTKNYIDYWNKNFQFNYIIEIREHNQKGKHIKKVGSISIWGISWLHKRAEIGIWINSKYWNQGFANKALNLIKTICFTHLKLNRLEAHIAINNNKSINLFKKCGFLQEGTLSQYLNLNGKFLDALTLCFLKKDWKQ